MAIAITSHVRTIVINMIAATIDTLRKTVVFTLFTRTYWLCLQPLFVPYLLTKLQEVCSILVNPLAHFTSLVAGS